MPRWEPNARQRLVLAAIELFAAHGYENTTVIEIAERAGVTKSTFFRHFPDKREVLFGGDSMSTLLLSAIIAAPAEATPLEVVAQALDAVGREMLTPAQRGFGARRRVVIAANPELQEREALKGTSLAAAMIEALERRGVANVTARAAAALGTVAFAVAYERWTDAAVDETFGDLARQALSEVKAASASLVSNGTGTASTPGPVGARPG